MIGNLRYVLMSLLACFIAITGCEDQVRADKNPKPRARATISPDRGDYLSTAMRARESAMRQLGQVDKERREDIQMEKTLDRSKPPEPTP